MAKTRYTSPHLDIRPPGSLHPGRDLAWAPEPSESWDESKRRDELQVRNGETALDAYVDCAFYAMRCRRSVTLRGDAGDSDPWTDRAAGKAWENEEPRLPSKALGKCA
jgi:hypothetical protein